MIMIYPTTVIDVVTIDLSNYRAIPQEISLYDNLGRMVKNLTDRIEQQVVELDLNHLPAGVYFIRVDEVTKKLIKL